MNTEGQGTMIYSIKNSESKYPQLGHGRVFESVFIRWDIMQALCFRRVSNAMGKKSLHNTKKQNLKTMCVMLTFPPSYHKVVREGFIRNDNVPKYSLWYFWVRRLQVILVSSSHSCNF